jgi:predicted DNA-binding transcriptional regulator AlpA
VLARPRGVSALPGPLLHVVLCKVLLHGTVVKLVSLPFRRILAVGRSVDAEDLVGTAEIAARLGLALPQTVHDWRRRHDDFPEPVTALSMGLVWVWSDVAAWAERTGRPAKRGGSAQRRGTGGPTP